MIILPLLYLSCLLMASSPADTFRVLTASGATGTACSTGPHAGDDQELVWPEITTLAKPWTRWWWMGSAVNRADLTAVLEEYHAAGLGGVEISPIYGVQGYEDRYIEYLSPEWTDMFLHTLEEAGRLKMGVDMICGTGWPFGGPWITAGDACKHAVVKIFVLKEGEHIRGSVIPEGVNPGKPLPLLVLMAYSDEGERMDLTGRVDPFGRLEWTAPAGTWTLYGLFQRIPSKRVKNAAPGGAGNVVDHFSSSALDHYLEKFDSAFQGKDIGPLRSFFNDSYELTHADWTNSLAGEFLERRGYDLYDHLPALFGEATEEEKIRVFCDYRTTIAELVLEDFTLPWREWAHGKDALVRNQAHGSPGNLVDLYAASDIPETETSNKPFMKLASSAAHIAGSRLTSAESCVWLKEHFLSTLADARASLDNFFLSGGNHVIYHGTTFSPPAETWPGWIFYASVHFGPTNPIWNNFPALNRYVARCQSFLQSGLPDNELLFYYPFYDLISDPQPHTRSDGSTTLVRRFYKSITQDGTPDFYPDVLALIDRGYSFDYITDRYIEKLVFENGRLKSGNSSFRALVLPPCQYIPVETFEKLVKLADKGAVVLIHQSLPGDVPGLARLEQRQAALQDLKEGLMFKLLNGSSVLQAKKGKGAFFLGNDLDELLSVAGYAREPMVDMGLQFIRRKQSRGSFYFIVNQGKDTINNWVPVNREFRSAALFDPETGSSGQAGVRKTRESMEVYLQLLPGESCLVRLFDTGTTGSLYPYVRPVGAERKVTGPWKVTFLSGGPELPDDLIVQETASWTGLPVEAARWFSGTARYSTTFKRPVGEADCWILDLGRVAESARVRLNGKEIGTLIGPHFYLYLPARQLKEDNLLEIDVSNLMANRIADLDRRTGGAWRNYRLQGRSEQTRGPNGFTAKNWEPKESGLMGPVELIPADYFDPVRPGEGIK